jgi:hypothetical protein
MSQAGEGFATTNDRILEDGMGIYKAGSKELLAGGCRRQTELLCLLTGILTKGDEMAVSDQYSVFNHRLT